MHFRVYLQWCRGQWPPAWGQWTDKGSTPDTPGQTRLQSTGQSGERNKQISCAGKKIVSYLRHFCTQMECVVCAYSMCVCVCYIFVLKSLWRRTTTARGRPGRFWSSLLQNDAPDTPAWSQSGHRHLDIFTLTSTNWTLLFHSPILIILGWISL